MRIPLQVCQVPAISAGRKSLPEIESMVEAVKGGIDSSRSQAGYEYIDEEEAYISSVVRSCAGSVFL